MTIDILAYVLVLLAGVYLLAGLLFCITILVKGLSNFDPNTRNSGVGFKLLIIPGIVAFWPFLWKKWFGN